MGSWLTSQTAEGRTAQEAYESARAEAEAEYGHQQGYSGAINSKGHGFVPVTLPPRMTYTKFRALLEATEEVGLIDELRDAIDWRKGILDRNQCKRSERPAVRKLMKADEAALRKHLAAANKLDERIVRAGFDRRTFERYVEIYHDKWAQPLCVVLSTRERKPSKRGHRFYVFTGYAPC